MLAQLHFPSRKNSFWSDANKTDGGIIGKTADSGQHVKFQNVTRSQLRILIFFPFIQFSKKELLGSSQKINSALQ